MEFTQLEDLITVAEERSFSRAAKRMNRTQPAVSQSVRKLEMEVGEPLLERGARDVSLTQAGELLTDYARRLLQLARESRLAVDQLRALERGELLIAANEYTCMFLLLTLGSFRQHYPEIRVTIHRSLASNIPQEILERRAEFGVLTFVPNHPDLAVMPAYTDRVAFIVSPNHPFARLRQVHIHQLGGENFIAHNVHSPLRDRIVESFAAHNTPLNIGVELPSLDAIKKYVAQGHGVALVPELTVSYELARRDLIRIPVPELDIRRQLYIVYRRKGPASHASGAFLKEMTALLPSVQTAESPKVRQRELKKKK